MAPVGRKLAKSAVFGLISLLLCARIFALDLEPRLGSNSLSAGFAVEVTVSGNLAYLVARESGLQVFDISDPIRPRPMGAYVIAGYAVDVAVSGNYAYLTSDRRSIGMQLFTGGGLDVIDVSNPSDPRRLGGQSGRDSAITVSGNYAFVAASAGLRVVDISNPSDPQTVANVPVAATAVAISGNYAYLGQLNQGFQIWDISDPLDPQPVGAYATNGYFTDIAVSGNYAYLADQTAGLHVVDISDPTSPRLTKRHVSSSRKLAISGNYAYLAAQPRNIANTNYPGGLHIIDISNPADPRQVGIYGATQVVQGVAISGNHAYTVDGSALTVIDIINPANPRLAGGYGVARDARDLALSGNYAFVADGIASLEVYDITGPPQRVGGLFLGAPGNSIAIAGTNAFLIAGRELHVININDAANPERVTAYDIRAEARNVAISGNFAYVAAKSRTEGSTIFSGGLYIIDISNPAEPALAGMTANHSNAIDVAVSGDYAYVTAEPRRNGASIQVPGALDVIDISDPANPEAVGRYVTAEHTQGVGVSGDFAYVADGSAGMQVINVNNPTKPERVGVLESSAYSSIAVIGGFIGSVFTSVTVASNHCYVAEAFLHYSHGVWLLGSSVQIVDVRNPAKPVRVGSSHAGDNSEPQEYAFGKHAQGMVVSDGHVFVAGAGAGLQTIDVRHPAPSQILSRLDTGGHGPAIAMAGNYAYVAEQRRATRTNVTAGGLRVIDISDPANPRLITNSAVGEALDVSVAGTNGCLIIDNSLQVLDLTEPSNPKLAGNYPDGTAFIKVEISGNHAYVVARPFSTRGGLHVIDISNPAAPQRIGGYNSGGEALDLAVSGNYVYVAQGPYFSGTNISGGLQIIDITDPRRPQPGGAYNSSGKAYGVALAGQHAYVVGHGIGLHVVNITNPAEPQRIGACDGVGNTEAIALSAGYAYIVDAEARLHMVDVRDPANPRRIGGNTSFTGFFHDVVSSIAIANGKVFVGTAAKGMFILHPYQPIRVDHIVRANNGTTRLQISGPPGVPGRVQRSGNLLNWTDWLPINFTENPVEIVGSDASPLALYRIIVP